ncbi:DUF924 domain-containing protein [Bdellovibrio sp. ZAP7]|uniref:DUF924 family protein n=1 Tax=Bdellovibrio sp. ZAP7 TaxID=2231053 RepID=UPI00115C3F43|nr:DUF924 family protein [Bdellovibrio sp. ZAP7]QDK46165.1 DUF924 domain-containing protein [Bdellovibrio sp. ZAP7]
MDTTALEILKFWFEETEPRLWFAKDQDFDSLIRQRFSDIYAKAENCELYLWRKNPRGRLAEIIILDQFSRNMFRDTPRAFKNDTLALALAQTAVASGDDQKLKLQERAFIYLPYMHSESEAIHHEAMRLFSQQGLENNLEFELAHKSIIDRFGRYPYRNEILGRESTREELEFLKMPGSSF